MSDLTDIIKAADPNRGPWPFFILRFIRQQPITRQPITQHPITQHPNDESSIP
jgi:hypothetical protein